MPKIIPDVRASLIRCAKAQLAAVGYSNMTVRSVAQAAGVGVGTVYNYFPSKDDLVAECMLEDWGATLAAVSRAIEKDALPRSAVLVIYSALTDFIKEHSGTLEDESAKRVFRNSFMDKHKLVRESVATVVRPIAKSEFGARFFAEAIFAWIGERCEVDELMPYLVHALEN